MTLSTRHALTSSAARAYRITQARHALCARIGHLDCRFREALTSSSRDKGTPHASVLHAACLNAWYAWYASRPPHAPHAVYRLLGRIEVRCNHHESPCEWTGEWSELASHLRDSCPFEVIKCDVCKAEYPRKDREKHIGLCDELKSRIMRILQVRNHLQFFI